MSENALIPVESVNAADLFTGGSLDDLLEKIRKHATDFTPDVETDAGRKEIASMAYKVARSKTTIDNAGKDLVADWKRKAKEVDNTRRKARDFLDALKDEVRKPLSDWEAEQERLAEEARQAELARQLKIEAAEEEIHEVSGELLLGNREFDALSKRLDAVLIDEDFGPQKDALEGKIAQVRAQIDKAKEMAAREAELAAREAELKRQEDEARQKEREEQIRKEAAEKAARDAQEAVERANREKAEAAEKARRDQEAAVKQAEERAAREAQAREQQRLQDEADARAAEEKRAANKLRQKSVKAKASAALSELIHTEIAGDGNADALASSIIEAIAAGKVPAVSIDFK